MLSVHDVKPKTLVTFGYKLIGDEEEFRETYAYITNVVSEIGDKFVKYVDLDPDKTDSEQILQLRQFCQKATRSHKTVTSPLDLKWNQEYEIFGPGIRFKPKNILDSGLYIHWIDEPPIGLNYNEIYWPEICRKLVRPSIYF